MFQTRVFTFGIFTNDGNINIAQTRLDTGKVFTKRQGSVHVKVLTHSDIERFVTEFRGRSEKSTLDTNLVTTKGSNGFLEKFVIFRGQTRNIVLFKFNRNVGGLEDILDRGGNFLTDTITRNKSDRVLSSILFGEDL